MTGTIRPIQMQKRLPRLAQSDIHDSIFVAKGELDITEGFEGAAVQANILLESFKYESPFIVRGFCFSRHVVV